MPACTDFSEHIIHRNKTENKTGMKKKLLNIAIAASAVLFASGCSENATEDFTDRLHDLIDRTEEKINSLSDRSSESWKDTEKEFNRLVDEYEKNIDKFTRKQKRKIENSE